MTKVLVVDRERTVRQALNLGLHKNGYEVIEAVSGPEGIEAAGQENIDIILLDVNLPKIDGWEVLTQLKRDRHTRPIPVIMMARFPSNETEETGMRLGAAHVLTKPLNSERLMLTIRVVLRDAQRAATDEPRAPMVSQDPAPIRRRPSEPRPVVDTGGRLLPLEKALGGGLHQGSMTLLEGNPASGKSVVCYYLVHGSLADGRSVTYFTSKYTADGLAEQMASLGMGVTDDLQEDFLRIYPVDKPGVHDDPAALLAAMVSEIESVPANYGLIVVDNISGLAVIAEDRTIMSFFTSLQRLCEQGKTILVVAQTAAFDQRLTRRLHGLCNNHISISSEMIKQRFVNVLEVLKAGNVDLRIDNKVTFQVEPVVGIKIIPMSRIVA